MDLPEFSHSDKAYHCAGGMVIGYASAEAVSWVERHHWQTMPRWARYTLAILPSVLVGVLKEVYDHQHPDRHTSDWQDAGATVIGGAVGLTLSWSF